MKQSIKRIYVDTNVLNNFCTGIGKDTEVLSYIFKKRRKELLFTSSLAVVQTITNLQTNKRGRKAYSKEETISRLNKLLPKFTFIDLKIDDVVNAYNEKGKDLEDCVHYELCKKANCEAILTNNTSDFALFDVIKISPAMKLRAIKSIIS